MNKKVVAVIVSFTFVIIISIFIYSILNNLLIELANDSPFPNHIRNETPRGFNMKLFVQCFSFLFVIACLPFVFIAFADKMKINKQNFWIAVLVLDLVGLIVSYTTSPPDMTSTMMIFALWQLPVIVNFACLMMITRKKAP